MKNIATFLKDLNVNEIVTPVKEITQFLEKDFIATDPQFIASIGENMVRAEVEKRRITNTPMGAKKSYAKILLLGMIIAIVGGIGWWAYSSHVFENGIQLPGMPNMLSKPTADTKYSSPEAAKAAVDRGEVKLSDFSTKFQDYIRNVKPPQIQQKIELTP